jgi:hypothetical protein
MDPQVRRGLTAGSLGTGVVSGMAGNAAVLLCADADAAAADLASGALTFPPSERGSR